MLHDPLVRCELRVGGLDRARHCPGLVVHGVAEGGARPGENPIRAWSPWNAVVEDVTITSGGIATQNFALRK